MRGITTAAKQSAGMGLSHPDHGGGGGGGGGGCGCPSRDESHCEHEDVGGFHLWPRQDAPSCVGGVPQKRHLSLSAHNNNNMPFFKSSLISTCQVFPQQTLPEDPLISAAFCSQDGFTGNQCNGEDGGRGLRHYHHQQQQQQQPSNHFKRKDGCVPASNNLFNIPLNSLEFGEKNQLLPLSKPQDGAPASTDAEGRSRELSGTESRSSLMLNPLNFSDSPFTSSPWMKGSAPDQSADSLSFSHRGSLENQHRADKRLYHAENQVPGFSL